MQATSRDSLAALRGELDALLDSGAEGTGLAGDVHGFANVLETEPRLRRVLSDPAAPVERRQQTAAALLDGKVAPASLAVISSAVGARWSSPFDLIDSLVEVGNQALFAAAEQSGGLPAVEDELFRFGRILESEAELATLFDDRSVELARRAGLLRSVLGDKVQPITQQLLVQALAQPGGNYALRAQRLADDAAARQHRSFAKVRTAVALTGEQERRLAQALTQTYGRAIEVRAEIDPAVRGGLVIRVGDELIDGSVATRLAAARTALAGG
ncbi:MAG: F0F1 ATP synthase subunit delta [Frankiaceae bacterium]|jgi:F-type H+-transporting ATPase subunit delta|nr:F0F1 ATP synthase subunit delta [Frankiaceae bacterium]